MPLTDLLATIFANCDFVLSVEQMREAQKAYHSEGAKLLKQEKLKKAKTLENRVDLQLNKIKTFKIKNLWNE